VIVPPAFLRLVLLAHIIGIPLMCRITHSTSASFVQALGGARGIKCMVWETSLLDSEEVSLSPGVTCPVQSGMSAC
jgi:hypothetical protein